MLTTAKKFNYIILFSALIIIIIMAVSFLLHFVLDIPFRHLTADPNILTNSPIYFGFISQTGIIFWSAAATTSFIFAYLTKIYQNEKKQYYFFIFTGLLISWLMIDDCFLLHEGILPGIGVPQTIVLLVYILAVLYYLFRFKNLILKNTPFILLILSFGCFGISAFIDVFFHFENPNLIDTVLEDGSKFIGIILWLAYILSCERLLIKSEEQ